MIEELFLYTWDEVLCEYNCGYIYIIAKSLEEARQYAKENRQISFYDSDLDRVLNTEPLSIQPINTGIVITCRGSA